MRQEIGRKKAPTRLESHQLEGRHWCKIEWGGPGEQDWAARK